MIATVDLDGDAPRVRIDTTVAVDVYRVDGLVRTKVRGPIVGNVIYDYECPQERPVYYSSLASPVLPLPGTAEESGLVELPEIGLWLIHLGTPALSRRLTLAVHDGWVIPSTSAVVDIPGGDSFAVTFPRGAESGSLRVKLWSRVDFEDFRALVKDGSTMFLSAPYELGIDPGYVVLGDVAPERVGQWSASQMRFASFSFRFVRRPEVVVSSTDTIDALVGSIDSLTGTIDSLGA